MLDVRSKSMSGWFVAWSVNEIAKHVLVDENTQCKWEVSHR